MSMDTLQDLFEDQLKDVYNAEKQLVRALPRLAKKATDPALKKAFEDHLQQTKGHITRLEQVFGMLDVATRGKKCKAMEGLIEEGKEVLEEDGDESVIDAALIASAQRVEHYEMAAYGCLRVYADLLGHAPAAKLLQQTLAEEEKADQLLTQIAEQSVNQSALSAGEAEAGDDL